MLSPSHLVSRAVLPALLVLCLAPVRAHAQKRTVDPLVARGDPALAARHPDAALAAFDSALAADSGRAEVLWRAALAEVELGEFEQDATLRARHFGRAEERARAAVQADSSRAEPHYALARVLGQRGRRLPATPERANVGRETHERVTRCLALAPRHPGCLHILGVWNATVAQLDAFSRSMARQLTGSEAFTSASWAEAERLLTAAAKQEPRRIAHRLELARVYAAQQKLDAARQQLSAAERGALMDANDARRLEEVARERAALR